MAGTEAGRATRTRPDGGKSDIPHCAEGGNTRRRDLFPTGVDGSHTFPSPPGAGLGSSCAARPIAGGGRVGGGARPRSSSVEASVTRFVPEKTTGRAVGSLLCHPCEGPLSCFKMPTLLRTASLGWASKGGPRHLRHSLVAGLTTTGQFRLDCYNPGAGSCSWDSGGTRALAKAAPPLSETYS